MVAFLRLLWATSGRALAERGLATHLGLFVVAAIVFGGNGLSPATVTDLALESWQTRSILFAAWVVITLPAAAALFTARASFVLRTLPLPRAMVTVACVGLLAGFELPWVALWAIGAGPAWAIGATLGVMALTTLAVARVRTGVDVLLWAAVGVPLVAGSAAALAAAAAVALGVAVPRAWTRGVERGARQPLVLVLGPSLLAVVLAYLVSLVRGHRAVVLRGVLLWLATGAVVALALRNNSGRRLDEIEPVLLSLAIVSTLLVTVVFGVPVERIAHRGRDVLVLGAAPAWLGGGATRIALATVGALASSGLVGAGWLGAHLSVPLGAGVSFEAVAFLAGAGTGAWAAVIAEWARRGGGRAAGRLVVALVGIGGAAGAAAVAAAPLPVAVAVAVSAAVVGIATLPIRATGRRTAPTTEEIMLKVTNVSKRLGAKRVLRDVSLACDGGEVLTVTGDNGAGKSTLLRVLVGLLQPDRGVVTICGHRLGTFGVAARRALGFVPDAMDAFPDLLVGEYVHLVAALKRGAQASDEASRPELAIDGFWHQRLGALSLGQRRRVDLHCALLGSPWLLVLDEPSSGLDTPGIEAVQALIRQRRDQGLGAVIATNDASFERALEGRNLRLEAGLLRAA